MGAQYILGALLVLVIYFFSRPKSGSQFRSRETDIKKTPEKLNSKKNNQLADAKYKPKPEPLRLEGVVLSAAPHELLKIKETATEIEIQKAFRELMKQYHPDKVGRPGTREWKDAQAIAEALNRARNQMLEKLKSGR